MSVWHWSEVGTRACMLPVHAAAAVELGKARQHVESSATASLAPSPSILGAALGSSRPPVHTTSQSSRSNSGTTPEHILRSSIAASTGSAQGRGKLGRPSPALPHTLQALAFVFLHLYVCTMCWGKLCMRASRHNLAAATAETALYAIMTIRGVPCSVDRVIHTELSLTAQLLSLISFFATH
ncbi:hypothetical protein HaLaN_11321 [Haematococcus lacustris]|uniref:Uncharacterized protein n=1 Tax=Haematococcus lacustris TaxID=44745 RepID=A0A699Z7K2_HAELA|nr:hypothetical protein HaLaN_11321 [Haematococcus lacustris]